MGFLGSNTRRGTPAAWLVVGLGNPGKEYERSRHNVGFEVVDLLGVRHGVKFKLGKHRALEGEARLNGDLVAFAKPTTYMNLSGEAVAALGRRHGINEATQIIVVHDELDLEPGVVKVKAGGGLAGHNGLRSVSQHLHTNDYLRVRIGVGKPAHKSAGVDHVLKKIGSKERELLDADVQRAADAVEAVLALGAERAMNAFNSLEPLA
jgi:PTH1 family peptidyl-tRNA hydrolase